MGITASRDVGLDATPLLHCQHRHIGHADRGWDGLQSWLGFLTVVGVIGERACDDELTHLLHGKLHVVILLKASISRVFHDARLRVGIVVLVAVTGSWRRWCWRAATRASIRRVLPLRALRHRGLLEGLLRIGL